MIEINILTLISLCLAFLSLGLAISNLIWNNIHSKLVKKIQRLTLEQLEEKYEE